MNQNEAEELDSKDGNPDRPEEIGNQPGPPRVEYLHCTTSTHQRTQGGGGCSKLDASLGRHPPQTGNGFALAMRRRCRERRAFDLRYTDAGPHKRKDGQCREHGQDTKGKIAPVGIRRHDRAVATVSDTRVLS